MLFLTPRRCTCTYTHYLFRLIPILASNVVFYRLALVLENEPVTETVLHAQGKEIFALGARGGHVTCATEM